MTTMKTTTMKATAMTMMTAVTIKPMTRPTTSKSLRHRAERFVPTAHFPSTPAMEKP